MSGGRNGRNEDDRKIEVNEDNPIVKAWDNTVGRGLRTLGAAFDYIDPNSPSGRENRKQRAREDKETAEEQERRRHPQAPIDPITGYPTDFPSGPSDTPTGRRERRDSNGLTIPPKAGAEII